MKQRKANVWLIIGVVIAAILLMIWLFVGTTLEEDANPVAGPTIEVES